VPGFTGIGEQLSSTNPYHAWLGPLSVLSVF